MHIILNGSKVNCIKYYYGPGVVVRVTTILYQLPFTWFQMYDINNDVFACNLPGVKMTQSRPVLESEKKIS